MAEKTVIKAQLTNLLPRITEIFASANINFLLGSGISNPYLPTLNNIEKEINEAINKTERMEKYKEYFEKVMLPNKNIVSGDFNKEKCFKWDNKWEKQKKPQDNYKQAYENYKNFLITLSQLILDRKTTVISKQINIFTTNIDIFFEKVLEDLGLHYNDGFLGKMNPVFDLSNFKQSIIQRSHHFDNSSEIPVFNLFKIHGSVNWKYKKTDLENTDRKIYLSPNLSHFDNTLLRKKIGFIEEYKNKMLVVNPEETKFSETVLNKYYYELLRSYSSELERENSILFVIGFSMADKHIREITKRAARSNPTLQIYIFLYLKAEKEQLKDMETSSNFNIKIIAPENDEYHYDLNTMTNEIFKKIDKTE